MHRLLLALCCVVVAAACDSKSPPAPPVVNPPPAGETITGSERIGWEQRAGDVVELAGISYVLYVDGARTPLADATCTSTAAAAGFSCSARLPAMTAGLHTLQLASTLVDGSPMESERSATLTVTVRPLTAGDVRPPDEGEPIGARIDTGSIATSAGARLRVEEVAHGFEQPVDLAFLPDGRLLVAERRGTVRIVAVSSRQPADAPPGAAGPLLSAADGGASLLALAVDPQFERTRFVFALFTTRTRSGEPMFTLARFRETAGTLADRVVLLDGVRAASPRAAGALRFGPDLELYAAFDDGGDARTPNDLGSLNGKVLRLEPDGTTPRDQAGATPLYSEGHGAPIGLAWDLHRTPPALWVADRDGASSVLRTIADSGRGGAKRGTVDGSFSLPRATVPSSLAIYDSELIPSLAGSVLVASEEGRHLLAISGRHVERLLQDRAGPIAAIAAGRDGAIYFANAGAVGRIVPDAR